MDDREILKVLQNRILTGSTEQVRALVSPFDEPLLVHYTPAGRGALFIKGKNGYRRFILDGVPTEPPWVKDIGPKFEILPTT
jgi:hypothetical protein